MASKETHLAGIRKAAKAGSWYTADPEELSDQLDKWLGNVPDQINGSKLPIPGARVIIAPHAGYFYSGPCAAWAYKILDLSNAKRIFVLGPSHTYGFEGCDLTTFASWDSPLGQLKVDEDVIAELRATGQFGNVPRYNDLHEHSLEMHIPYIYKRIEQTFGDARPWPTIVPIVVGDGSSKQEKRVGRLLATYIQDPTNAFVVSSDFCHWGTSFKYTCYCTGPELSDLTILDEDEEPPTDPPIHEAIRYLDEASMAAVESGAYDKFRTNIRETGNTVCGRHPIGVVMAALEHIASQGAADGKARKDDDLTGTPSQSSDEASKSSEAEDLTNKNESKAKCKFAFVQYRRSKLLENFDDSSVSYASAYAVV